MTVSGLKSSTSYTFTITATNVDGTSLVSESSLPVTTQVYVAPLAAPAFTLSAAAETKTVNTAITGYTISSTGGTIASYAISPAAPAGLAFNTATGVLSGTPSSTQSATAYTITATNATGSATRTFTLTVSSVVYTFGQAGPGGGIIFYVSSAGFDCGSSFTSTGSPTGGKCNYLEAAPSLWAGGAADPKRLWAVSAKQSTGLPEITDDFPANNNSSAIGLGYKNSLAIVAQGNDNTTAAFVARGYNGGSKSDWYLPTTAELNLLCQWARGVAPSVTTVCTGGSINSATYGASSAGFVADNYWSSSEGSDDGAWLQTFLNGGQFNYGWKGGSQYVRPIRAF